LQQLERPLGRPGLPVDAVGHERVADGEDAPADAEPGAGELVRVALAVQPLVVRVDQCQHLVGEAAELAQQALAGLGVALDLRVLGVVERAGVAQDPAGDRQLADVVQQAAASATTAAPIATSMKWSRPSSGQLRAPEAVQHGSRKQRRKGDERRQSRAVAKHLGPTSAGSAPE
jgi:hypothetical protein